MSLEAFGDLLGGVKYQPVLSYSNTKPVVGDTQEMWDRRLKQPERFHVGSVFHRTSGEMQEESRPSRSRRPK